MDEPEKNTPNQTIGDILGELHKDSSALDIAISLLPETLVNKLVIVGGQSLKIWGEMYLIDEMTAEDHSHLSSYDLDLVAVKQVVLECAEAWGGKARIPEISDNTPSSGAVTLISSSGATVQVDFLKSVYGVENDDVQKHSELVEIGGKYIRVLSPPICLKSRICNLVGLYGQNEKKRERELNRIKLTAQATRNYIISALEKGDIKTALNIANFLIKNVFLSPKARQAVRIYNAEFIHALPHQHEKWPEKAKEIEFPKRLAQAAAYYTINKPDQPEV